RARTAGCVGPALVSASLNDRHRKAAVTREYRIFIAKSIHLEFLGDTSDTIDFATSGGATCSAGAERLHLRGSQQILGERAPQMSIMLLRPQPSLSSNPRIASRLPRSSPRSSA